MNLIRFTDCGLYCEAGGFYIDPWQPVDKAVITHAHSDHARWGSNSYLSHKFTVPLMQLRAGSTSIDLLFCRYPELPLPTTFLSMDRKLLTKMELRQMVVMETIRQDKNFLGIVLVFDTAK